MNSWSRMKLTLSMFKSLCVFYELHPGLVDLVAGMGYKSGSEDEHFSGCYRHLCTSGNDLTATDPDACDLCYNISYFEKHGRNTDNPWSLRQSALYHKYYFPTRSSAWIVVQPPNAWESSLDGLHSSNVSHPLEVHIRFIRAANVNFREYLNYMNGKLSELDQRVSFPKPLAEYDFDFALHQDVHALRRKLFRADGVLAGTIRVLTTVAHQAETVKKPANVSYLHHGTFERQVACLLNDLESYRTTLSELLSISNDIKSTIDSVLEFRNQETLQKTNAQLQLIAEHETRETKAMSKIATWTYNDSRTTRIATVIALIYLPASLVLAFFDSVFVELGTAPGNDGTRRSRYLVIHHQLWVAVVSAIVLVIGTFGAFSIWKRPIGRPSHSSP